MRNILSHSTAIAIIILLSCRKDPPSTINQAPVAHAGRDTTIILPVNNIILDGSASFDADGAIMSFSWTQISGAISLPIFNAQKAQATINNLVQGAYSFELKITDDRGSSSKDTVTVTVQNPTSRFLVANAGPDQTIQLPVNTATLDGSASHDSSGAALNFIWRQITGQGSTITNSASIKTFISFSQAGIYEFELKIWNNNGEAKDTIKVTVTDLGACNIARAEVPARLTLLQQLPLPVSYGTSKMLVVGHKIFIPQEWDYVTGKPSANIFVYDVVAKTLTTMQLSTPRSGAGTVVAGTKIFFAGGTTNHDNDEYPVVTDVVDIYDAATNVWSTAKLSQPRTGIKAAVAGNKVVFAGGLKSNLLSNKADIYDIQTGQWTASQFHSEPRIIERVVTNQNNIYFLGGFTVWENVTGFGFTLWGATKTIDIYNATSGGWSTNQMQTVRYGFSAVSVDDKIIIAGGAAGEYPYERITSNVEIIKVPTMERSNSCLATPIAWYYNEAVALKNGSIIFYLGTGEKRKFNIYNPQTGAWTLGVHNTDVDGSYGATVANVNNDVYMLLNNTIFKLDY